jgi:hypothetical protein
MFLKTFDDFFSDTINNQLIFAVQDLTYGVPKPDSGILSVGGICDLGEKHPLTQMFLDRFEREELIQEKIQDLTLERALVNNYAPLEHPNFHIDKEGGITLLYTIEKSYNLDDGGETFFYMPDEDLTIGVPPRPKRLIMFDGGILHKGSTFRNRRRYNIVFQYSADFE